MLLILIIIMSSHSHMLTKARQVTLTTSVSVSLTSAFLGLSVNLSVRFVCQMTQNTQGLQHLSFKLHLVCRTISWIKKCFMRTS